MVRAALLDIRAPVDATGVMVCRALWAPGAIWGFLVRRGLVVRRALQVRLVPVDRKAPRVLDALARLEPPVRPVPAVCRAPRGRRGKQVCQCEALRAPRVHRGQLACRGHLGPLDLRAPQACPVFLGQWGTGTVTAACVVLQVLSRLSSLPTRSSLPTSSSLPKSNDGTRKCHKSFRVG